MSSTSRLGKFTGVLLLFTLVVSNCGSVFAFGKVESVNPKQEFEGVQGVEPALLDEPQISNELELNVEVPEVEHNLMLELEDVSVPQVEVDTELSAASVEEPNASENDVTTGQRDDAGKGTYTKNLPKVADSTGAMVYEYKIVTPPGRNGVQPNLVLSYNNQSVSDENVFGYGWSLNLPYIQRMNKTGTDNLYEETNFYSSFDGELLRLEDGLFGAKVESGSFNKYELMSDGRWVLTDKFGTRYEFGVSGDGRVDNASDVGQVYQWMLQLQTDTNGNSIEYRYTKIGNQVYPSKIVYTSNGTQAGIFTVQFFLEDRPDVFSSNLAGFDVATTKRATGIVSMVGGAVSREYKLDYVDGENGSRSLLHSVTDIGYDENGVRVIAPPTTFDYSVSESSGWVEDDGYEIPDEVSFVSSSSINSVIIDVNGDGYSDLVSDRSGGSEKLVHMSNTNDTGWSTSVDWSLPDDVTMRYGGTFGNVIADVNGDKLPDILSEIRIGSSDDYVKKINLNNGVDGWADVTDSWELPSEIRFINNSQMAVAMPDINGDGFADIMRESVVGSEPVKKIFINNADNTGWTESHEWAMPDDFKLRTGSLSGKFIGDLNGDNLPDLIYQKRISEVGENIYDMFVFINNGKDGWDEADDLILPDGIKFISNSYNSIALVDVNGDGLNDFIFKNSEGRYVYLNNGDGTGWTFSEDWRLPDDFDFTSNSSTRGYAITDVNSDGLIDLINQRNSDADGRIKKVFINQSNKTDLISRITYPTGGYSEITYKPSTFYKDSGGLRNPGLPIMVDTVYEIASYDGVGNTERATYTYEDGEYYYSGAQKRKLTGFGKTTMVDAVGNITVNYFHQGNGTDSERGEFDDSFEKIGKLYRTEKRNDDGDLYNVIVNKWGSSELSPERYFVKNTQVIDMTYDGNSTHKDKAKLFTYEDATGNVIEMTEYGEVSASDSGMFIDAGNDLRRTVYAYASNVGRYILGLKSSETKYDFSGLKIKESRYYYDNGLLGSVFTGNNTKTESWISGVAYSTVQKTFKLGLPIEEKDPRGFKTKIVYDQFYLYPLSVTNPLGQITQYTYDYSSGEVRSMRTPNGRVFGKTYDGFDRVKTVVQPNVLNPAKSDIVEMYTYQYLPVGVKTTVKGYLSKLLYTERYEYTDGFDRQVQTRSKMESGSYAVKDLKYNNIGKVAQESLLYESIGSRQTVPVALASIWNVYGYDSLGRVSSISNAVGTTVNAYDDWGVVVIDPRGVAKELYSNAFDELARVVEHNGLERYVTNYSYDGNGNLIKLTDALGNVRNFSYNGIGKRVMAEDLHNPADTTFGTWLFKYDLSGNNVSEFNPNKQTVVYVYDALNRVLSEDFTGASGTEIVYGYDVGTDGIGRLTSVRNGSDLVTYEYDPAQRIKTETKVISGQEYVTRYGYDFKGNVVKVTNPDLSEIVYGFNNVGKLEDVSYKESYASGYTPIIADVNYGAHGKEILKLFANGLRTVKAYDEDKLYRLEGITTSNADGSAQVQNLTYSYDSNNNVTGVVDGVTATAKTLSYTYDDLNRLTSATASGVAAGEAPYTQTYSYNAIGNIIGKSDAPGVFVYAGSSGTNYANPHAVIRIGLASYVYDKNGNLLSETGGLLNTWNYKNQLTRTVKSGITSTYVYDHEGQRVVKSDSSGLSVYPTDYYSVDNLLPSKYISDPSGNPLATVEGTGESAIVHYLHTDHLGGTTVVTNSLGGIDELTDYYPFGGIRFDRQTGTFKEKRKFTGHEYDSATALNYMNARYQDPRTGKFLSQDPAFLSVGDGGMLKKLTKLDLKTYLRDPQGLNSYSYAGNNPVKNIDSTGNYWGTAFDLAIFALSVNDYKENPTVGNAICVGIDGLGAALPVFPAVIGGIRHADEVAKMAKDVSKLNSWGNPESLMKHFIDHGVQFEAKNANEYARKANDFYRNSGGAGYQRIIGQDGTIRIYDSTTNTFGSYNVDGSTKTFFRPDNGSNYWKNQVNDAKKNVNGYTKKRDQ